MGLSQTPQALVPAAFTSGGMTLISTTSLSGTTTTLSSIPQIYQNLQMIIIGMNWATGNSQPTVQLNATSSGHYYSGSIGSTDHSRAASIWYLTDNDWTRTDTTNITLFNFYDYKNTSSIRVFDYRGMNTQPTGGTRAFQFGGCAEYSSSAIESISISTSNAYSFTGGTVLLYGVK